jgi:hypothetical protein
MRSTKRLSASGGDVMAARRNAEKRLKTPAAGRRYIQ